MNNKQTTNQKPDPIKIPPHNIEAEQSVIGGLMIDNDRWDRVSEIVDTQDFYARSHKIIFKTIKKIIEANQPLDLITLSDTLSKHDKLDDAGGISYLAELAKNTPSAANITAYADIVRDSAKVRNLISVANEIADSGYNPDGNTSDELLDHAESKIFAIAEESSKSQDGPIEVEKILENTLERIELLYKSPQDGVTGISTGFIDLNKKTAGLQNSDLIIVAARPSMGKTTFAMNLCENAALDQDKPVLVFSLEMPAEQLMMRMLASLSRVDQTKIRTGQLEDEDWARISSSMGLLMNRKNIYIDDSSGVTPTELRSRARRVARDNGGLSMIMVDYLQLMRVPGLKDNRTLEIAEISRSLKALAKELNVPVVALSQLNRSLEQRSDKRPVNSDLRESGAIEQDADLIMFIYRDEVYNEDSALKGVAEIIIGKQRNGPIGTVKLSFQGQYSRFESYISNNDYN
ncbi:replicative DNA helicase [Photobacterium leiognathi]|uniref:replicative DNA helicase n=1 Tax=Photobacterium leiognathi TaxID=553611 RepID=UPI002981BEC0|nr:replicative DNA helicase [Photobacterium leiognathi]